MGDTTIAGNGNVIGNNNIVTITYQGAQVIIPSLEAVAAHRAALRRWLEDQARRHGGEMASYVQQEAAELPVGASPYDRDRLGTRENLLSTLRGADRLLVLGERGAGKTVALERLAWELCNGPIPLIPVLIPLSHYDGKPLADWVRAKLKERGCLRLDNEGALTAFLETAQAYCFFLFDGLDKVALPYRDALVGELERWMGEHPRHGVICTSQPQDELWLRLRGEMRAVVVQVQAVRASAPLLKVPGDAERGQVSPKVTKPKASLDQADADSLERLLGFPVVYVPAGPFWMGSDKAQDPGAGDAEVPKHQVTLPGYWIAKTPVTVAQFRAFVEAEGYDADENALMGADDHPVVFVSWDDALVYCRWQSKRTGLPVTLPSEAEWEKAARGTDGRLYPWGNAKPDIYRCNFGNHEKGTTPVGRYSPQGDSPYGCVDMAGNVCEWTRSLWGQNFDKLDFKYPYDPKDGRESLRFGGLRVLRGGAFLSAEGLVRCAGRLRFDPNLRLHLGFRPVLSPYL